MDTFLSPIERACSALGSQAALAGVLNVTPGAVNQWVTTHRPIPAERCPDIERATNGAVTREELRPDVDWAVLRASPVGAGDTPPEKAAA